MDKEKRRIRQARYRKSEKGMERARSTWRAWKYGISEDEYKHLLENQSHCCAVCKEPASNDKYQVLVVDHNHSTGEVRGLLCRNCNVLLGHSKDSVEILSAAIGYLNSYRSSALQRPDN